MSFLQGFRLAAPYINAHREHSFVIALSGAAIAHDNFKHIVHDIAVLHSLGIRLTLVHGFRHQLEHALKQQHIQSSYHHDLRITTTETLHIIEQVAGQLRINIEAAFSHNLENSPLRNNAFTLFSGNLVNAKPMGVIDGVNMQHTGSIRSIDGKTICKNLAQGQVALLSTLAYSNTAQIYNLSLSELAQATAQAINADKIIFFSEYEGILNTQQQLIRQINISSQQNITIQASQQRLYKNLSACVKQGVNRAHVLSYKNDGALLQELFTYLGSGTLISQEEYEYIRNANEHDINRIIELIEPFEQQGILIKRSRSQLEQEVDYFTVIECDDRIVACAALYPYTNDDQKTAEIACIATHHEYQKKGLAAKLLAIMEEKAQALCCDSVFVLSTQTSDWFIEHGFVSSNIESLPSPKKDFYNYSRNAVVLTKTL